MARINDNVCVESFQKSKAGKTYRDVYFMVGKHQVSVRDIVADSEALAYLKAVEILKKAEKL